MNTQIAPDAPRAGLTHETNPPFPGDQKALYGAPGASQSPLTGFYGDRAPCLR